jgi:hypothetical protein
MLKAKSRRDLLKDHDNEPAMRYVVLAKCAAGLAIVAGLGLVAIHAPPETAPLAADLASNANSGSGQTALE